MTINIEDLWEKTAENWPSELVSRTEVDKFTGGLFSAKTMANKDCLKEGPKTKIRFKRKVAYPKADLVAWLCSQSDSIEIIN